eukprot:12377061-Prorocentrum_lima.AAC.1
MGLGTLYPRDTLSTPAVTLQASPQMALLSTLSVSGNRRYGMAAFAWLVRLATSLRPLDDEKFTRK